MIENKKNLKNKTKPFCDMLKLHEIQISMDKILLEYSYTCWFRYRLWLLLCCHCWVQGLWESPEGLQSWKCLLSGSLQEMFADAWISDTARMQIWLKARSSSLQAETTQDLVMEVWETPGRWVSEQSSGTQGGSCQRGWKIHSGLRIWDMA